MAPKRAATATLDLRNVAKSTSRGYQARKPTPRERQFVRRPAQTATGAHVSQAYHVSPPTPLKAQVAPCRMPPRGRQYPQQRRTCTSQPCVPPAATQARPALQITAAGDGKHIQRSTQLDLRILGNARHQEHCTVYTLQVDPTRNNLAEHDPHLSHLHPHREHLAMPAIQPRAQRQH